MDKGRDRRREIRMEEQEKGEKTRSEEKKRKENRQRTEHCS